jgi:hypothetical protein
MLPLCCFITLNFDKAIPNTSEIYSLILTLEKAGTVLNYLRIFVTLVLGV